MSRTVVIVVTLVAYNILLIGIGLWARRRTRDEDDFFLGGRRLGPWVAAISASASSSSAWTLLGVSGAAYLWGLPAIWLIPATISGFAINWFFVAPRLMPMSRASGAITLTGFLAGNEPTPLRPVIVNVAAFITVFAFLFYIAAQFQAAGNMFNSLFDLSMETSMLIGAGIVVIYILLGGFWAVSVTDTVQGLLMAASSILLPAVALVTVGGFDGLMAGLRALNEPGLLSWSTEQTAGAGLAFAVGLLGIGWGYPGQPHVVNRFMALRDAQALKHGRRIAMGWAFVVYIGMVILGLCARVLMNEVPDNEQVFFLAADELLPPVVAGVVVAAVLSAIMSTTDSQLLVAASSVTHDSSLRLRQKNPRRQLLYSRVIVVMMTLASVAIAIFASAAIFSRVLFAWHAVGSAFGPILLIRISGRDIRPGFVLTAMCVGFLGTVIINNFPDTPGDILERYLPFILAFAIAWAGSRSARNRT